MTGAIQPSAANVFAAAVGWLNGTLLGTVATTIGVIAVASIGLLMLSGRVDVRRAAQVIFGCFILFGASTIAGGIIPGVSGSAPPPPAAGLPPPPSYPAAASAAPAPTTAFDPYAGAALPQR